MKSQVQISLSQNKIQKPNYMNESTWIPSPNTIINPKHKAEKEQVKKKKRVNGWVVDSTNCGYGSNNLSKFELVEDGGFSSSIKTHH